MFILKIGDSLRSGAAGSNPSDDVRIKLQRQANAKRADTQKADAKAPEKTAPPPQELTAAQIYHNALIKTLDAAQRVTTSYAELQFEEGREASKKEGVNLSKKGTTDIETAHSIREGRKPGFSIHVGQQIAAEIKNNPKFKSLDQDALDVASKIVEAFMGGLV